MKSLFIYRAYKVLNDTRLSGGDHVHKFKIEVRPLNRISGNEHLLFEFQANDANDAHWYGCTPVWHGDGSNYSLVPLIAKMKDADIRWSSTPEQVMAFLELNAVEAAVFMENLPIKAQSTNEDERDRTTEFSGLVSRKEIFAGVVKRYNNKYLINRNQQMAALADIAKMIDDYIPEPQKAES